MKQLLSLLILTIIITGCTATNEPTTLDDIISNEPSTGTEPTTGTDGTTFDKSIGGEKDEHGCLGPAGYSWDKYIQACTRSWEITGVSQKDAAKIAVEHLSDKTSLTIISINKTTCLNCYTVKLSDKDFNQYTVELEDWKVLGSDKPSTIIQNFEECVQAGNPVMESYPRQCRDGDKTFVENIRDSCENLCSDGICQEVTCTATDCPCAETEISCPSDCN